MRKPPVSYKRRYKNVDMKMVELIKNEILDCGQNVEWDDIAGLEFAKETVRRLSSILFSVLHRHGTQGAAQGLVAVWSSWYRQDPHWEVYCTRSKLHLLLYLCLESDFQVGGRGGENCAGAVCSGQGPSAEWRLHLRD